MNPKPIQQAKSASLRGSLPALQRAAARARQHAAQTGTAIVVTRDGVMQHIYPSQKSEARMPSATKSSPSGRHNSSDTV